jgi:hypothetical protein
MHGPRGSAANDDELPVPVAVTGLEAQAKDSLVGLPNGLARPAAGDRIPRGQEFGRRLLFRHRGVLLVWGRWLGLTTGGEKPGENGKGHRSRGSALCHPE